MGHVSKVTIIGLQWAVCYSYHYIIAKLFLETVMLNMVNILAAILTSLCFIREIYELTTGRTERHEMTQPDLLTEASHLWQTILAGAAILSLIAKNTSY